MYCLAPYTVPLGSTTRPSNHVKFYVLGKKLGFRESQNYKSESNKTKIFIDKVPITFHPLVGLMHNRTTSKEPTDWPSYRFNKEHQS